MVIISRWLLTKGGFNATDETGTEVQIKGVAGEQGDAARTATGSKKTAARSKRTASRGSTISGQTTEHPSFSTKKPAKAGAR